MPIIMPYATCQPDILGYPVVNYSIGMVIPQRDPMTPLIAALVQVAWQVAPTG
jgi:hypothetical protein